MDVVEQTPNTGPGGRFFFFYLHYLADNIQLQGFAECILVWNDIFDSDYMMLWDGISWKGRIELVKVNLRINVDWYLKQYIYGNGQQTGDHEIRWWEVIASYRIE